MRITELPTLALPLDCGRDRLFEGCQQAKAMIAACCAADAHSTAAITDRMEPRYWTTSVTSFDTPLVPHVFVARRRTKYVPLPTLLKLADVAELPRLAFARFARPGADPASMM